MESFAPVTSLLSNVLGINTELITKIITMTFIGMIGLFIYLKTGSILITSGIATISCIALASLGFLPIWILFMMIPINVFALFWRKAPQELIEKGIVGDRWENYGTRIKTAYTAKFGYENPEFNEAVDQHILVMQSLRKGITRDINYNWLKRMAHMTEYK